MPNKNYANGLQRGADRRCAGSDAGGFVSWDENTRSDYQRMETVIVGPRGG